MVRIYRSSLRPSVRATVGKILQLAYRRIQFTPDLMPADITGTNVLQDDPETDRTFWFSSSNKDVQRRLASPSI
jgi:MoxR-like ATPase